MKTQHLLLGLLLSFLLLSGCSQSYLLPEREKLSSLKPRVELVNVPFYPQKAHQCAPAALATVLNYQGVAQSPDEIAPYVYLPERQGSIAPEVVAYARQQGLLVYRLPRDFLALLQEVEAGNPVLVFQNLAFDWLPQWHYAVVIGYDLDKNQVILRSAYKQRWVTSFKAFNNTWRRAERWAYVISKPDQLPVTAKPLPILQAALDLEEVGQLEAADKVYKAGQVRWPQDKRVLLAVGNYYYSKGDFTAALKRFEKLTQLFPEDTDGWNNLAYSYLKLGCKTRAMAAIKTAIKLKPNDPQLQDSYLELQSAEITQRCTL